MEMLFAIHTGLNMANPCRAFFSLALMCSSVPPVWLILLPRYTKSSTSVTAFLETVTGPSCCLLMRSNLVFLWLIFRPAFCAVVSRFLTFSSMSCRRCDNRAKSSANARSSNFDVRVHWMPFRNFRKPSLSPSLVRQETKVETVGSSV